VNYAWRGLITAGYDLCTEPRKSDRL
jgi:hypothetical protein